MKRLTWSLTMSLTIVALLICWSGSYAQDMDGDGISDEHEKILGTDPQVPDNLIVIHEAGAVPENKRGPGYDPAKDVTRVEFCHVAENRYLWRSTFAAPPKLEDMVHHYYIDADNDPQTGRIGRGVEYMLSVVGGRGTSSAYAPDGTPGTRPPGVSFVVVDNTLLVTADCDLGRDDEGVAFSMYVLCHTISEAGETPPMSKHTAHFKVAGIPVTDHKKIIRLEDYTTSENVTGTFGLDIIRPMLVNPRNIVVNYDELELDGFSVHLFTQNRYGHLLLDHRGGQASTKVPRAGRYYVGFMIYDDAHEERIGIFHNDKFVGLAVINGNNNRTWIYHLSQPLNLQAGDKITLQGLGNTGTHGICNILLLPQAPRTRQIEYQVANTRWIAPVGTSGEVSLSWTTTWPSASRFEYGLSSRYGRVAEEECTRLVHRAALKGLRPGITYRGRGVGTRPDGTLYYGPEVTFTADGGQPPRTKTGVTEVPLTVRNVHEVDAVAWPVSGGVPFPQGVLGDENDLRVVREGEEVLSQVKPLGVWPDGSLKWVLITLLTDVPAGGSTVYTLQFGREVRRELSGDELAVMEGDEVQLKTGAGQLRIDRNGDLWGPGGRFETQLVGDTGTLYSSSKGPATLTVEEAGPVRAVVRTVSNLRNEQGEESMRLEQRLMVWRDRPYVQVQHTFVNDRPAGYTNLESLSYLVPAPGGQWQVSRAGEAPLALGDGQSVWQQTSDDIVTGAGEAQKGRLVGGALAGEGAAAAGLGGITVRDCWQNYPKGFAVTGEGLRVDLAPDFEKGFYDEFPFEQEGHHLYYYLRNGQYRFKQGMAKTHNLLVDFSPQAAAHARLFQRPLLLTATPQWYTGSMAFYNVAPRDEKLFAAYERAVDKNVAAYAAGRERQRDYGLMNFGDWYGERGVNWGNIEYDTQHAFFLEYIRSGNIDAFYLGEEAELHNRDIDTVQWSPRPSDVGLVWVHSMGHVGGYYSEPVPGSLGITGSGTTVTHAWSEGHFDHYYLTGDPRSLETGMAVAEYFTDKELCRPYDWVSAREPGWHLIMLASALAATNDPYYLNAARIVVDRTLEAQDPSPRELPEYQKEPGRTHQDGGWTRMMVPGHCLCEPRHRGNANFMIAVLLTGLTYYHDVTAEPAVKDCIIRGARYLVEDMYSTQTHGFRYTSCPNMRYGGGVSPLMAEGIARAYRWTRDPIFEDVLTNGLSLGAEGAGYGKNFSMYYRCAPRLLADLAAVGLTIEDERPGARLQYEKPQWLAEIPAERLIVVQAEDRSHEEGGQAEVVTDRQGAWGTAVSKWHANVGHWLEWKLQVPVSGKYRLVFRYGTQSENTRRRLEIDGQVPHPAAAEIAFPTTGGFGHNPADWAYLTLQDEAEADVLLSLAAGEHAVRMTNLEDGLSLDFFILQRVD